MNGFNEAGGQNLIIFSKRHICGFDDFIIFRQKKPEIFFSNLEAFKFHTLIAKISWIPNTNDCIPLRCFNFIHFGISRLNGFDILYHDVLPRKTRMMRCAD